MSVLPVNEKNILKNCSCPKPLYLWNKTWLVCNVPKIVCCWVFFYGDLMDKLFINWPNILKLIFKILFLEIYRSQMDYNHCFVFEIYSFLSWALCWAKSCDVGHLWFPINTKIYVENHPRDVSSKYYFKWFSGFIRIIKLFLLALFPFDYLIK
jgi:hypothetical protein